MSARVMVTALILLAACRMDTRRKAAAPDVAGARAFVVEFYAWYNPKPDSTRRYFDVLTQRHAALTPDLAALLDADLACSTQSHEICNLDSDPFVNSQDPCERYEVGGAITHHDTVGVSVFGVCSEKRDTIPAVIAMVVPHDSGWRFTNFVYPAEKTDLRAILSQKTTP
jgi:hypothetical protein